MTNQDLDIEGYFRFLNSVIVNLDETTQKQMRDVQFGQWELNFEALLLKLLTYDRDAVSIDIGLAHLLAAEAGIDTEGVLDPETWKKFRKWADKTADS